MVDQNLVKSVQERAVKTALAKLYIDLMSTDRYEEIAEYALKQGVAPAIVEQRVAAAISEDLQRTAPVAVVGFRKAHR